MKKLMLITLLGIFIPLSLSAQRYMTRNGNISFYSKTPMEDIEAHNNQVSVAVDFENGSMAFRVLIKSFTFEKALMQQHFNENYMTSDKYPTATFNGTITDFKKIDLSRNGTHQVEVTGNLTIRGVTNKVTTTGTIEIRGGKVIGISEFQVRLKDYKVKRPKAVAEVITIRVNFEAVKI
jgi:polyisoprenoid-binding protein YceI